MDQPEDTFGKLESSTHFPSPSLGRLRQEDYRLGDFLTSGPTEVGSKRVIVYRGWPSNFQCRTFARM